MVKNGRLDLRIDGNSKNRLIAKAKYLNMSLTKFIEKVADDSIVFMDNKLVDILKSYGYNLNTLITIEENEGSRNINSNDNKDRGIGNKSKIRGDKR